MKFFGAMRIPEKFVVAILAILVVPISISGLLIYRQLIGSAEDEERQTLIRSLALARQSIESKLQEVERTGTLIATNAKINEFLDSPFEWIYSDYETYDFLVGPALDTLKFQNKTLSDLRVYYFEPSIPERFGNGGFYSYSRIASQDWAPALRAELERGPLWREGPAPDSNKARPARGRPPFEYYSLVRSLMSGRPVALMRLEAEGEELFEALRIAAPKPATYFVSDRAGTVIYSSRASDEGHSLGSLVVDKRSAGEADSVVSYHAIVGGAPSIAAAAKVESLGVELWAAEPTSRAVAATRASLAQVLAVCLVAIALLIAIASFVVRALLSRLEGLVAAMGKVEQGDLSLELDPGPADEFGELAASFNSMLRRIEGLLAEVVRLERAEKKAEIAALEAQINPHFLYNTLSAITWEARKCGAKEVEELSLALSKFYRATLSRGKGLVRFGEDLDMLGSYLVIQERRMGDRLSVAMDIEETARSLFVPKVMLQPIVENSIKHGFEPRRGSGRIEISARIEGDRLAIRVADDGVGMSEDIVALINEGSEPRGPGEGAEGSGFGLRNLRDRITFRFGPEYGLSVSSSAGSGATVAIALPTIAEYEGEEPIDGA
jgi:Predicted signal transduction protein with a C-terminal ATPase domain